MSTASASVIELHLAAPTVSGASLGFHTVPLTPSDQPDGQFSQNDSSLFSVSNASRPKYPTGHTVHVVNPVFDAY
jgi:hypothetical protein